MLLHTGVARFLAACHQRRSDATPIRFMRQAGRCLTQYQELRQRYDILTMAKTPELCARVTLMPVEQLGVDAAVLYAEHHAASGRHGDLILSNRGTPLPRLWPRQVTHVWAARGIGCPTDGL